MTRQGEPWTFMSLALPTACLLIAALVAALPPARRAGRIDLVAALRLD